MVNINIKVVDSTWEKKLKRGFAGITTICFLAWVMITWIFIHIIVLLIANIYLYVYVYFIIYNKKILSYI